MIPKIVHLEPYFPTGEMTVQPVLLWANGKPCYEGITKHASVGSDYFKSISPVPGHSIVYLLALGAWETYGENRNGDGFPEFPYNETENPPWISPADVLTQHYKTFEQYGHNYRHHMNKDPLKKVGDVMKAFWNPSMHRVELLVDLDNAKAPDLAERIASGEFPPVSMGTRVRYDVCSICGNQAPTRAQYCLHLKFQMRDVVNGKKVCALNPSPKFFDISWVFRPADRTAFMMKKVAEPVYELISGADAGEYLDAMDLQKLAARKLAVLDKIVQGIPVDAKTEGFDPIEVNNAKKMRPLALEAGCNTPDLPDSFLKYLSQFSFPKIFSSTMASGLIRLSTPEITKIIMFKQFPNSKVPEDLLSKSVLAQNGIFNLFEEFPNILNKLEETGILDMGAEHVDEDVVKEAMPYMEKRSGIPEYLKRRFIPERWRKEVPNTMPLTITDPATGAQYMTTRGAAVRAHDEIAKRNLYKIIGGGALLGGAYHLIGNALPQRIRGLKPLLGLGLGLLGATQMPSMGKHYMTEQGIPIPTMTELTKMSAAPSLALPIFGTLGAMAALSHDYQSRLRSGIPIGYEGLPLSRRILDSLGEFVYEHPIISAGVGVIGGHRLGQTKAVQGLGEWGRKAWGPLKTQAREAKEALKNLVGGTKISSCIEIPPARSTVLLPNIDLDKVAEWLGWVIMEG